MQLSTALAQKQELRFQMNHQLLQSIKMMELPVADLRQKIEEEVERNPALEIVEDNSTVSLDEPPPGDEPPAREEEDFFEAPVDFGFSRRNGEEAAEARQKFLEGVLTRPETLQEHLLWQLALEPVESGVRRIAETLIQNLDSDGFYLEPLDALFGEAPPPEKKLIQAVNLVRSLDPQGTCTADYRESLRVQAELLPNAPKGLVEAVSCLDILEKKGEAEKRLGLSGEELQAILCALKELSPFPGRRIASGEVRYVIPDVKITRSGGDFLIIINEEEIPVLGINPFFTEITDLKQEDSSPSGASGGASFEAASKEARNFARERIREARLFIQAVNKRNETLLKVTWAILDFQRSFFAKGPKYLAPLTLQDIARELDIDNSTVSRTAKDKYVQTEWGIFELRHFFTNSISGVGSGGSSFSKEGVKEILREMLDKEGRRYSDQELAGLLKKRGISLARRTVAKYRKELDMGSSYSR